MVCAASSAAARPAFEVADIVRDFGEAFRRAYRITPEQAAVLRAIVACRTAVLGGHLDTCDACGFSRPSYNSCRNRHCPKCQALTQAAWLAERQQRILPVGHFHIVFTVPSELHPLAAFRREEIFNLLFQAAAQTLLELGRSRLGLDLGLTMVLHTWTRDLRFHPHVHVIATAGGLSLDRSRWVARRDFLIAVRALGALFRGKFLAGLRALRNVFDGFDRFRDPQGFDLLMSKLARKRWVVYAKRPFGIVDHVFEYLGRYTHRVGISNRRLIGRQGDTITFATKDGATASITGTEFLRRFVQHVLPDRFVKIRHYGLYASSHVDTTLARARALLAATTTPTPAISKPTTDVTWKEAFLKLTGIDVDRCPVCRVGTMLAGPLPPSLFDSS